MTAGVQPHRHHHTSAIKDPTADNLVEVVKQLKEAVETQARVRDPEGDEGMVVLHELRDGRLVAPGRSIDISYNALKIGSFLALRDTTHDMTAAASPTAAAWLFNGVDPAQDTEENWVKGDATDAGRYVVSEDGWYMSYVNVVIEPLGSPGGATYEYYGDVRTNGVSCTDAPARQTGVDSEYTSIMQSVSHCFLRRTDSVQYYNYLKSSSADTYDVTITWDLIRVPGQ